MIDNRSKNICHFGRFFGGKKQSLCMQAAAATLKAKINTNNFKYKRKTAFGGKKIRIATLVFENF